MNPYMHDPDEKITPGLLKSRTQFLVDWIFPVSKIYRNPFWTLCGNFTPDQFSGRPDILDVGEPNAVSQEIHRRSGCKISNTNGDLNECDLIPILANDLGGYRIITCLEILEHLQNPLLFLQRLQEFTAKNGILYLTTPRATFRFLKMPAHFHEFEKRDLLNLLDMAGWEVIEIGLTKSGYPWWLPFRTPGFRPLCRALFQWSFYVKAKIKESK